MDPNFQRICFDLPRDKYPMLKMICAEKQVKMKDFVTDLIKKSIDEYIENKKKLMDSQI